MWYHFSINRGKRFQGEGELFMNEYELINQAKEGCEDAFESIFKKYVPVVLRQKRRYYLRYYELDDWLQEGRIVCHQSIANFDAAQNVTFGLFLKSILNVGWSARFGFKKLKKGKSIVTQTL